MTVLSGIAIAERFARLDEILLRHPELWRNQPFTAGSLAWEAQYPGLAGWLRTQSLEHAERYQLEPAKLPAPEPYQQWVRELAPLTTIGRLPLAALQPRPERMASGVPGRKWQQIEAFARALPQGRTGAARWLDWCSGKGFLGRYLAWPDHSLRCIEQDPVLVAEGSSLSKRWQVMAEHVCCDALSPAAGIHLAATDRWAALHACGDLHTHLLRKAGEHPVHQLAVAPCCYNRTAHTLYRPLSEAGRASALALTRSELGIPLQATVTAGAGEVRKRNRMMAWRLGFDLLQRQWRGEDSYLPVPSVASRWTQLSFAVWCAEVAGLKGVTPRPVADWKAAEQAGWQRLSQVRNLELVQGLFRRPLELWLLLDMALYLQEQGFAVQLGEFCSQQLTPRNLLVLATRG